MPSLTDQAELALIGALLANQDPPAELGYLRVDDFAHRAHGALFHTITDLRAEHPTLAGDPLITAVALHAHTRGIDATWLTNIRDTCPDAAHVAAYARMVQAAGFRRDIAGHAERIATAAAHTVDVDGQAHLHKLADALARQAEIYAAFHTIERTSPDRAAPEPVDVWRVTTEEELLADLLQHPEQAPDLAQFLHRNTFTNPQRRDVYETLVRLGYDHEDIDEVIVCWEMANLRAITPRDFDPLPATPEPDAALLHRLANTRTTRSAIEIGRDLLTDDLHATLSQRLDVLGPARPAREHNAQPTSGTDPRLRSPAPPNGTQPAPRIER
jgi:replicative DNA helicase